MGCRRRGQRSAIKIRLSTLSTCEFSSVFLRHVITTLTFSIIRLIELRHDYHVRQNGGRVLKERKKLFVTIC